MPEIDTQRATPTETDEDELRLVVGRLSRPDKSGGRVIERAAILAEGGRSTAILAWLEAHDWRPEDALAPSRRGTGLHGAREHRVASPHAPVRYVLAAEPD